MKQPFKRPGADNEKKAPPLVLAVVLTVFFIILLSSVVNLIQKQRKIKVAIRELESENQVLVDKQKNLEETIGFLETEEGKEQVLRDKYRLVKPGEGLVVITDPAPPGMDSGEDNRPFFKRFFDAIKRVF